MMQWWKKAISFLLAMALLLPVLPAMAVSAQAATVTKTVTIPNIPAEEKSPANIPDAYTFEDVALIVNDYYATVTKNGTAYWNKGVRNESAQKSVLTSLSKKLGVTKSSSTEYLKVIPYLDAVTNKSCPGTSYSNHGYNKGCLSNGFNGVGTENPTSAKPQGTGWQCQGFAAYMAYVVFGERAKLYSSPRYGNDAKNIQVKPGDVLRITSGSGGHSIFVYAVEGTTAKTIECNLSKSGGMCKIYKSSRSLSSLKDSYTQTSGKYFICCAPTTESVTSTVVTLGPKYINSCTKYKSYFSIKTLSDGYIKSLPCSRGSCEASDDVRKMSAGENMTAIALYKNPAGNYWYQVVTPQGQVGFIFGSYAEALDIPADAAKINANLATTTPAKGKSVNIDGTMNTINMAAVSGTGTLRDALGATQTVKTSSYLTDLEKSDINQKLKFGSLSRGPGQLELVYESKAYYTTNGTDLLSRTLKKTATLNFTVMETYNVVFNANGGSNAPANQQKKVGTNLSLTTAVPSRSGYLFQGWAETASAKTAQYQPGDVLKKDVYSGNFNLYAVWKNGSCSHTYSNWNTANAPTCTEAGSQYRECTKCGEKETQSLPAKGHQEQTLAGTPATCKATGLTEGKKCSVCGTITVEQEIIPSIGHNYVKEVVSPTPTSQGYTQYTCATCGDTYQDNYTDPIAPSAPEIQVSTSSKSGKPVISWSAAEGNVRYEIYRSSTAKGTYNLIKTISNSNLEDTSAKVGTKYYYKVRVRTADDRFSDLSSYGYAVCKCAAPVVTASNISSGKIKLTWKKVSGASKYYVYRATSQNGTYKKIKTVSGTTFTDTSTKTGKTYYYKVKAVASSSTYSSVNSVVVKAVHKCARPTVKITLSSQKPKLSWNAVSGAKRYEIYRATSQNGSYTKIKTTTSRSFRDTTAKKGKTYYYKVKAVAATSKANSAYSSVVKIKSK